MHAPDHKQERNDVNARDWDPMGDYEKGVERRRAALRGEIRWGPWRYNPETSCLETLKGGGLTSVPIDYFYSASEALDTFIHVQGKTWADDATIGALLRAAEELLSRQANLCHNGNRPFDPEAYLRDFK
jgi:hypothetical protein